MQQPAPASEHRSADRFGLALPITMEGEECAIHDLSATGLLVEAQRAPAVGATVDLKLAYFAEGQSLNLTCQGEVVRVEKHGDAFNVAVKLNEPLYEEDPAGEA